MHEGFSGSRRFMTRKKDQCKLIGNRLEIPNDTIPSNVMGKNNCTAVREINLIRMGKKIICTLFLLGFLIIGFSQDLFNKGIQLNLLNGDRLLFDNYKGKLIVLNIWGTWCAPWKN